jgi:hypothetical protein
MQNRKICMGFDSRDGEERTRYRPLAIQELISSAYSLEPRTPPAHLHE